MTLTLTLQTIIWLVQLVCCCFGPLRQYNSVDAVFLCDHTSSCEAYSFITDRYWIFNVMIELYMFPLAVILCELTDLVLFLFSHVNHAEQF